MDEHLDHVLFSGAPSVYVALLGDKTLQEWLAVWGCLKHERIELAVLDVLHALRVGGTL